MKHELRSGLAVPRRRGCPSNFARILCGLGVAWALGFGAVAAEPIVITSSSKQITVRGRPLGNLKDTVSASGLVLLDPSVLAVTGETLRQALGQELGLGGAWRGWISIELHPARRDREEIVVTSIRSPEGWNYRMDLPDEVDAPRLVRALVEVLLLEFAQRQAGERSVEFPPWLVPGLAQHLQAGPMVSAVLAINRPVVRTRVQRDPLAAVRTRLQGKAALTVDQLNWPADEPFDEATAAQYEACAQLFVHELLRLRGGPECLRGMLERLPQHLNWQTAFFGAFQPHFQRMLDVEKWWSLVLVNFMGRDTAQIWPLAESRQQLDEALYTSVQVRLAQDEIPHESQVSLQTILAEWDYGQQTSLLRRKVARLSELRPHLAPEVGKLADDYRGVLEAYLRTRSKGEPSGAAHAALVPQARALINDVLADLRKLDIRRERLWKLNSVPLSGPGQARPTAPSGREKPRRTR